MIPGDIVAVTQDISNAATAKTVFEAFGKSGGVFLTRKKTSEWENNRIVYVVINPDGTIPNEYIFRFSSGSISSIMFNASNYYAVAKTGDEYYFVGDTP